MTARHRRCESRICCPSSPHDHLAILDLSAIRIGEVTTAQALERQWNKRVSGWHSHVTSAAAFEKRCWRACWMRSARPSDVCVDLGAGTGFVALALAPKVTSVLAVDIAPAMAEDLSRGRGGAGLRNLSTEVCDLNDLRLPEASADLIVSSYALHHLLTPGKRALVARTARWLRPGGRLVIADMMSAAAGAIGTGPSCVRRSQRWPPRDRADGGASPRTSAVTGWASGRSIRWRPRCGSARCGTPASPRWSSRRSSRKPGSSPGPSGTAAGERPGHTAA